MSRTNGDVIDKEFYPTPERLVEAFVSCIRFNPSDRFREPCRGSGVISNAIPLPDSQKDHCELRDSPPTNYLTTPMPETDVIITNPPFTLFEAFILKSMMEISDTGTICYLLRVNALGAKKRRLFWWLVGKPTHVITCRPRPSFVKGGTDACEYAWFCWDRGNRLPQFDSIDWIDWKKA